MTLLDISNYQHPWPAAEAKVDGASAVIVGCQRYQKALDIIESCNDAGLPVVGLYAFLYWGADTIGQVNTAIKVAKQTGQKMLWLDCEDSADANPNLSPSQRIAELWQCVDAVHDAGLNTGIYTGEPFWRAAMGNTWEFRHLPLWYSNYGRNDATMPPITWVNFGGWEDVAIHQYTSQFPCAGMLLDANYNFMEEDAMTPQEKADFDLLAEGTFGPNWRDRLAELKENSSLEQRMSNMERDGDTVARQQITDHQGHGNVGGAGLAPGTTFTAVTVADAFTYEDLLRVTTQLEQEANRLPRSAISFRDKESLDMIKGEILDARSKGVAHPAAQFMGYPVVFDESVPVGEFRVRW